MNSKTLPANRSASVVMGIIVVLLIGAVLAGFHNRYGLSDRTAFVLLTVAGMVFCLTGMKIETYGWKNPFNLAGSLLGVIILLLVASVFTGIPFPGVASEHEAFIALAILISLKVVLDLLRALAGKLMVSTQQTTLKS
jgi:cytochrome b subunit of formate dehydrogenase